MAGRIFLLGDGKAYLVPMQEAAYDSEKLLQELLAEYPDLLAGDQIDADEPRRWLLVTREMKVPGEEGGYGRWSLDHLFLDQEAVPTLVEVKRSTDIRIRREVVGQMLDYAANAVAYWPAEKIRTIYESRCEEEEIDPEEELAALLGDDRDSAAFWQDVKTNLQAGRIRMVFVADVIPPELRRIVEFLNERLDPTEVLAVEVKQYVGEGMKTLVPRVIGMTEVARKKKPSGGGGKPWDEPLFIEALRQKKGETAASSAKALLDWLKTRVDDIWWGRGAKAGGVVATVVSGGTRYQLVRMLTNGRLVFRYDWLERKPPFTDEGVRDELRRRVAEIPGIQIGGGAVKRARLPLEALAKPETMSKVQSVVEWAIRKIRTGTGA
jgi:hypothetical protein